MNYTWKTKDLDIIDNHVAYHTEMIEYLEKLKERGPDLSEPKPKKTSVNLPISLKVSQSKKLTGRELNDYLLKLVSYGISKNPPLRPEEINVETMKKCLNNFITASQGLNVYSLSFSYQFGLLWKLFMKFGNSKNQRVRSRNLGING